MQRRSFLKGVLPAGAFSVLTRGSAVRGNPHRQRSISPACRHRQSRRPTSLRCTRPGLANIVALCDTDMGAKHTRGNPEKISQCPALPGFPEDVRQAGQGD
jgi:hypothetical protein